MKEAWVEKEKVKWSPLFWLGQYNLCARMHTNRGGEFLTPQITNNGNNNYYLGHCFPPPKFCTPSIPMARHDGRCSPKFLLDTRLRRKTDLNPLPVIYPIDHCTSTLPIMVVFQCISSGHSTLLLCPNYCRT